MSIFKDTFRKYVRNQISLREEIISTGNPTDTILKDDGSTSVDKSSNRRLKKDVKLQDGTKVTIDPGAFFSYTLNKQCVVRMTSLVDYVEDVNLDIGDLGEQSFQRLKGASLSQNFILQGGILSDFARNTGRDLRDKSGNKLRETNVRRIKEVRQSFRRPGLKTNLAYGDFAIGSDATSDGYGIVPMPGITDANIRTKSAYGSLREAKVTFEVHNQRQLEIMEMLYMRPGYMVLLEWGWCPYIKSSDDETNGIDAGNIVNHLRLVENATNNRIYTNDITQQEVFNAINNLKESQDGNYDGLLAIVKNFGFQARDDGGFNCFTELISIGEVMESLKIPNTSVFKSGIGGSVNSGLEGEEESRSIVVDSTYITKDYDDGSEEIHGADENIDYNDFQNALAAGLFPTSNGLLGMIQALNNYITFNSNVMEENNALRVVEVTSDADDSLINQKLDSVFPELAADEDDSYGDAENDTDYITTLDAAANEAGYVTVDEDGDKRSSSKVRQKRRTYLLDLLRFQSANVNIQLKKLLKLKDDKELKDYIIYRGHRSVNRKQKNNAYYENDVQQAYIRWDALSILFNESLIPKDSKASTPFSIITDRIYYQDKDNLRFDPLLYCGITAYDSIQTNQIFDFSCDANICILPNQFALRTTTEGDQEDTANINEIIGHIPDLGRVPVDYITAKYGQSSDIFYKESKIPLSDQGFVGTLLNDTDKFRRIGNIFLNVDMLLNIAEKNADNDEYTVGNFINDVWGEVNKVCPNHNFVLTDDKEANLGFIIDLPVDNTELPVEDLHQFIPYSNKNILREFQYTSNVPSSMTSTIAIQAQDPRSIQDIDGVTFAAFNRAIKNRILSTDIESNFSTTVSNLQNQKSSLKDQQSKLKSSLLIYIQNFFKNLKLLANDETTVGDGNIAGILKSYQKNAAYFATAFSKSSTFNSVIPLEFSATMDGISGIVIGNVFKIQKDRLPRAYAKSDIGFIVFNEEQKITAGGDWTTDISGKMIILPNKDKKPQILGVDTELHIPSDKQDFAKSEGTVAEGSETIDIKGQARPTNIAGVQPGMQVFLKQVYVEGLGFNPSAYKVAEHTEADDLDRRVGFTNVRSSAEVDTDDNIIGMFNSWELEGQKGLPGTYDHLDGAPGAALLELGTVKNRVEIPYGTNRVKILKSALSSYMKESDLNSEVQYNRQGWRVSSELINRTITFKHEPGTRIIDGEEYYVIKGGLPSTGILNEYASSEDAAGQYYLYDISTAPNSGVFPGGWHVWNSDEVNGEKKEGELRKALKQERLVRVADCVDEQHIWFEIEFNKRLDPLFLNNWSIKGGYIRPWGADDELGNAYGGESRNVDLSEYSKNNPVWMRDDVLAGTSGSARYSVDEGSVAYNQASGAPVGDQESNDPNQQ